jgi:hypothetical protein
MGTGDVSPGVKRPECEGDHSRPISAEVKKTWIYIPIPPYVFMAWCLVKYQQERQWETQVYKKVRESNSTENTCATYLSEALSNKFHIYTFLRNKYFFK